MIRWATPPDPLCPCMLSREAAAYLLSQSFYHLLYVDLGVHMMVIKGGKENYKRKNDASDQVRNLSSVSLFCGMWGGVA